MMAEDDRDKRYRTKFYCIYAKNERIKKDIAV